MANTNKPIANPIIVLREEFDDWAILFNPDSGDAHGLNPIGVFVWKRLDGKHTINDIIEEINIFGGSRKSILSQKFMGGRIISVFGGTELDFTDAKLNEGTNFLEIICAFGGISIIMPSDWQVKSEVISIIGGFADRRTRISNVVITNNKELIIKGIAIFGGGDIKSFKE